MANSSQQVSHPNTPTTFNSSIRGKLARTIQLDSPLISSWTNSQYSKSLAFIQRKQQLPQVQRLINCIIQHIKQSKANLTLRTPNNFFLEAECLQKHLQTPCKCLQLHIAHNFVVESPHEQCNIFFFYIMHKIKSCRSFGHTT